VSRRDPVWPQRIGSTVGASEGGGLARRATTTSTAIVVLVVVATAAAIAIVVVFIVVFFWLPLLGGWDGMEVGGLAVGGTTLV
jgi:hypothetical protein